MAWRSAQGVEAVKAVSYAVLALAGVYYLSRAGAVHKAGSELLKPAVDGLGNIIAKIRFAGTGVQYTRAGFYLNSKYIDNSMAIKPSWRSAIEQAHPGNAALFAAITNPLGQLKAQYFSLIDAEVNEETIK